MSLPVNARLVSALAATTAAFGAASGILTVNTSQASAAAAAAQTNGGSTTPAAPQATPAPAAAAPGSAAPTTTPAPATTPAPTTTAPPAAKPPTGAPAPTFRQLPPGVRPGMPGMQGMPGMPQRPAPAATPVPKLPANVFARIGNVNIMQSDILSFLSELGGYPLVQQRVQISLAEQQARKYNVTVTQAEINKEVQQEKDQMVQQQMMQSGQPRTFAEIAAQQGLTEGLLYQRTRFQILLRKAYQKSIEKTVPSLTNQIKLSHLLIVTSPLPGTPEASAPQTPEAAAKRDADALAKIKQIQADITAGKISWKDAIMKYSEDPSKVNNHGDLGWQDKNSPLVPEFLDAALKIQKVGDIVGPVKTQFGYHLIRLDEKASEASPAEKAAYHKDQMDRASNPQAVQAWFYNVTRSANVVYNPNAKLALPASLTTASAPATKSSKTTATAKK